MSKIVMVVAPDGYQDIEFEVPRDAFLAKGHEVTVASKRTKLAKGALGGATKVDSDISDIQMSEYDALVFIGGGGASVYFQDKVAHELAKTAHKQEKVIAAICIGPSILANAGILKGKRATAFPTEEGTLCDGGAGYSGDEVEVDGKIVTASGPPAAQKFAEEIVKLLE